MNKDKKSKRKPWEGSRHGLVKFLIGYRVWRKFLSEKKQHCDLVAQLTRLEGCRRPDRYAYHAAGVVSF